MVKVLSQSGNSLADMYDVQGSVAGIDALETRDLPIVHEMGGTLFSERFTTEIRRLSSGNQNQDTTFTIVFTDLPVMPARVLGIQVISDAGVRIARCALSVRQPVGGGVAAIQDMPIWVFDGATTETITITDNGAEANFDLLIPQVGSIMMPTFVGGVGQQAAMASQIALSGRTTSFGAGTALVTALLLIGFASERGSVSSHGVPIPSW